IERNNAKLRSVFGLQHDIIRILHDVDAVVVSTGKDRRPATHGDTSRAYPDIPGSIRVHHAAAMTVWLEVIAVPYRSGPFHGLGRSGRESPIRRVHDQVL